MPGRSAGEIRDVGCEAPQGSFHSPGGAAVARKTLLIVTVVLVPAPWPLAALAKPGAGVTVSAWLNFPSPPPGVSKQADAVAFFPKVASVHVGDPVTWQFLGVLAATSPGSNQNSPFFAPL